MDTVEITYLENFDFFIVPTLHFQEENIYNSNKLRELKNLTCYVNTTEHKIYTTECGKYIRDNQTVIKLWTT